MKKHLLITIIFTSFFLMVSLVCFQARGRAAETGKNFMKDLTSTLHLEMGNETPLTGMASMVNREKIYHTFLQSTSRLRISLSDHLKLFFNFQFPIKYYPGKEKDEKGCTILGMDIFF